MTAKFKIEDLSENRIKQAIDSLTKFHKDKIQTWNDSLDTNLEIALNLIEKQQAEIEKKDKIIDEMAEKFSSISKGTACIENNTDKEKIIEYFTNKVETKE